jgi:hypothetical protein
MKKFILVCVSFLFLVSFVHAQKDSQTMTVPLDLKQKTTKMAPFIKVVEPHKNSAARNGEHMSIRFNAYTLPNDGIDIDLYNESGAKKVLNIYSGGFGTGSSVPPAGPSHPNQYYYDWNIPFGDMMSPGYYKIRLYSWGKKITAWSERFYLTWPMRVKEYTLQPSYRGGVACSYDYKLPDQGRPVRHCEPNNVKYVHVGFKRYAGTYQGTSWFWDEFIRAQLIFPIEQFQGTKLKVLEAKLLLKKEGIVAINSNLISCAGIVHRLNGPLQGGNDCFKQPKTALVYLQNNKTEMSVYVTKTVEYWINKTGPNHGFLLTVADENKSHSPVETTCVSCYTSQLYLKVEKEYKGYE